MKSCYDMAQHAMEIAERVGVRVVYMQDMYITILQKSVSRGPELFSELVPINEHYVAAQVVKRLMDIVGSLTKCGIGHQNFTQLVGAEKVTEEI